MDYEKAFDSVQTQAILTSLQEQGIEDVYIEILKDIYTDSSDDLDKYWSDTTWQRTAQDNVIWRRHAEAFAQPRDTTAA